MAKKDRADFFDPAAPLNSRGKRINFKTDGQPDEALMQDLVDSAVFFNEDIASDAEAKANSGGVETKVPKVEQLPTVDTDDADIEIATDVATSTRNNFFVRLSTAFKSTVSSIQTSITNLNTSVYGPGGTSASPTDPSLLTTVFGPSGDPNAPNGGLVQSGINNIEDADDTNFTGKALGDLMYWDTVTSKWIPLAGGTSGDVLQTNGIGSVPTWVTPSQSATWKTLSINDWNMDSTADYTVFHGLSLTEYSTISNISIMIRDDSNTYYTFPIQKTVALGIGPDGIQSINTSNFLLTRAASGFFDSIDFDQISYQRGYVRFQYTPD